MKVALAFLDRVDADPALRAEAANFAGDLDLNRLCALGAAHGFEFTPADLRIAWRKRTILRAAMARAANR